MADYEVLGPGGHARLVSDIKTYVNRADGVGTTQLADESVTMDKLGDDVTDELDDIVHDGDPLSGNVLFGELAESTVLTADDAWAAPPKGVDVFGKSTQVHTTGKNLFDKENPAQIIKSAYIDTSIVTGSSGRAVVYIPCSPNTAYTVSRLALIASERFVVGYTTELPVSGTSVFGIKLTPTPYTVGSKMSTTITTGADAEYLVVWAYWSNATQALDTLQIELGSTATDYEPYTGGKPSPSPDYPQEIKSVDDLTLNVCGKNLLNISKWERDAGSNISVVEDGTALQVTQLGYQEQKNRYYMPYNGAYTLSFDYETISLNNENARAAILAYDKSGVFVSDSAFSMHSVGYKSSAVLFVPANASYVTFGGWSYGGTFIARNIQLELGSTATPYAPYIGQSITIPLSNHIARSLPDGTRDTLTLSYIGPSEREGWAWYSETLVQRVGATFGSDLTQYNASNGFIAYRASVRPLRDNSQPRCSWTNTSTSFNSGNMTKECVQFASMSSFTVYVAALESHSLDDFEYIYPLAEPITHDLGEVELPVMPSEHATVWCDGGSAQPNMSMNYERALSIVIPRIEAAISDLATS